MIEIVKCSEYKVRVMKNRDFKEKFQDLIFHIRFLKNVILVRKVFGQMGVLSVLLVSTRRDTSLYQTPRGEDTGQA